MIVMINAVFLITITSIFMSLISGTSATATIVTPYTSAVIGVLFILITIILTLTYAGERSKESERIGITATLGCLCGGFLIVYGMILIGGLLVMCCFAFVVLCRILW